MRGRVRRGASEPAPDIIQVCGYYPPHIGGIEFCVSNIAAELASRGRRVTVLTSAVGAASPQTEIKTNTNTDTGPVVCRLRALEVAHTPLIPALPWSLSRISGGAIIHLHFGQLFTDVVGALVATVKRRPLVAHFHMDTPASGPLGGIFRLYKRLILGRLLRRADAVIVLSDAQREFLQQRYGVGAERISVIPNGVADEFFDLRAGGPKTVAGQPFRLLFVGRLAAQKNIPLLLATMQTLGDDFQLDLVGDGELRAEVAELARDLPPGRVHLWGPLSGAQLRARYAQADAFVLTSDQEGMPLALLEAMAAGLPVVASDIDGLREHIMGSGLLVTDRTPEGYAAQITRLRDDAELRETCSQASVMLADAHRWSHSVDLICAVYAEVAAGTGSPRTSA
jgi:glycosyltransferase involved in cell wall biosynthesis